MTPELVVLDMAGTTVADDGLVVKAFTDAIETLGVPDEQHAEMLKYVVDTMGQSKITVFRALMRDETEAQQANSAFEAAYGNLVAESRPVPGAEDVIRGLRANGVKVAFTTGFAPVTQQAILDALGWRDLADLALAPGDGVRGRPFPDLVLTAALRLEVTDVRQVAVVGDTASDVRCGRRAGASVVAGVLTGAGRREDLLEATHILDSVRDLPSLLEGAK
ncbi:phosphonatase-like hydrolase [Amycolatopsis sp. NPDC004378]